MSGIKSKNTKPELIIRKALFGNGFRYRLHDKKLPGKPDLVLPKYRTVIFINGCFWHGHNCHLFKWPSTRKAFWKDKIGRNQSRDALAGRQLKKFGWNVIVVWECAIKGKSRIELPEVISSIESGILAGNSIVLSLSVDLF